MNTDNLIIGKRYSVSSNNDCVITDTASGYTLATISAGTQGVIVPISSSITSDNDCVVLPISNATVTPTVGQGGNSGNDYVVWSGEIKSEVTLNIPDDVDLPISFYNQKGLTSISGTTGGKTSLNSLLYSCDNIQHVELYCPNALTLNDFIYYAYYIKSIKVEAPIATTATNFSYFLGSTSNDYFDMTIIMPKVTSAKNMFSHDVIPKINITLNLASLATIDIGYNIVNANILYGGLSSCTSLNLLYSSDITDESIQNIIDALPDYTGTSTSALVTFPADRLTEEQQKQISNKGWTWS